MREPTLLNLCIYGLLGGREIAESIGKVIENNRINSCPAFMSHKQVLIVGT